MNPREIAITYYDMGRLRKLIADSICGKCKDIKYLTRLEGELDRAKVLESHDVPATVVTMNSEVRVKDMESGEEMNFRLVFPEEASLQENRISVLAPIGTAILGYRVGDVVEWEVPAGMKKFKILEITYQPETAHHYHL